MCKHISAQEVIHSRCIAIWLLSAKLIHRWHCNSVFECQSTFLVQNRADLLPRVFVFSKQFLQIWWYLLSQTTSLSADIVYIFVHIYRGPLLLSYYCTLMIFTWESSCTALKAFSPYIIQGCCFLTGPPLQMSPDWPPLKMPRLASPTLKKV